MENNAANAVRSTENTTKNQTTFRLGLHLSTAHGDSADTYADFNFAGSTPEEFDHALDVMRYGQDKPQNPALLIETPPLPTKTEPQTPPRSVERPHGARGLMFLHCPECNRTFKQFNKDFTESANCFCGAKIPLDNTTRFEYTCPACGKLTYGRTNVETATIDAGSMNCVCGTPCRELRWDPEVRSFHD